MYVRHSFNFVRTGSSAKNEMVSVFGSGAPPCFPASRPWSRGAFGWFRIFSLPRHSAPRPLPVKRYLNQGWITRFLLVTSNFLVQKVLLPFVFEHEVGRPFCSVSPELLTMLGLPLRHTQTVCRLAYQAGTLSCHSPFRKPFIFYKIIRV